MWRSNNMWIAANAYIRPSRFTMHLAVDNSERPYRIMWYQSGPYFAYYYSARYQDVINLADTTLYKTIAQPTLEESLYWRAWRIRAWPEIGRDRRCTASRLLQ